MRIAGSQKIAEAAWKQDLLEEAFRRAAAAQHAYKRRGRASRQDLDRCSLECRAVRALLPIDKRLARELFAQMPAPDLPAVRCNEAVYDVSAFYDTLGQVIAVGFSPKEIADEQHLTFAGRYLQGFSSAVQPGPAARMLAGVKAPPQQLQTLVSTFAAALAATAGDDRSYTWAMSPIGALPASIDRLMKLPADTRSLAQAWATFQQAHEKAARCPAPAMQSGLLQSAAVVIDEPEPRRPECLSAECREAATKFHGLVFSPEGSPLAQSERGETEWNAHLDEYLTAVSRWKADPALNAADLFAEKCTLYTRAADLAASAAEKQSVLGALLDYLQQNSFAQEDRAAWFLEVNGLLARAALDKGMYEFRQALRASPDPVISFYAGLDELLPRPPDELMRLF